MSVTNQTFSRTNLREFAATIDTFVRRIKDHVFSHSPALAIFANQKLVGGAGSVPMSGAGHVVQRGGSSTTMRVRLGTHAGGKAGASSFDTHNTSPDENTRLANFVWKFYTHGLAVSEHELSINQGDAAIGEFLTEQTEEVMLSLADMVADAIYTSGGATALLTLTQLINANDTALGLSGSTYANYNSRGLSARGTAAASVSFASGSFAAQGIADMRTCFNNASEGLIQPGVILTEYATHERYEGALQPQERFQGAVSVADGSFQALAFKGKPVLADAKCDSGSMYMLRLGEDGVHMRFLPGADFTFGDWKPSQNQNVMVRPLKATCALVIGNRRYGSNRMTSISD